MSLRAVRAFTLIELLVAVTLTLGLAAAMLSVTFSTLSLWHRLQDRFTTSAQAQLALDFVERDLQSAVFRPDRATTWLAVEVTNSSTGLPPRGWQLASVMKPAQAESLRLAPLDDENRAPSLARARFGVSGAWLRLVARTEESVSEGAVPRAISYQMARRPVRGEPSGTNAADVRYALYRSTLSGADSVAKGYNLAAVSEPTLTTVRASDAILSNVVDFGVWLHVRESDGRLRRIFPASQADLAHGARAGEGAAEGERYPHVADVMVRVLSEEGARTIAAIEEGLGARPPAHADDAGWWWAVVEAHSTVHVRRIELRCAPK